MRLPRHLLPAAARANCPTTSSRSDFDKLVTNHTMVNEQMQFFLRGFRRDAHPMAVMTGLVGALSAFYHDSTDINNPEHREIAAIRLIAKMPTLVAMAYKYGIGQPFIYPKNDLSYSANFMRMMFATPCEEYEPNDVLVRAHRPHLHPARRPRAERVHLDRAPVRQLGHQPVRRHRGRRGLPVGPGARRRQRGGAEHARGHPAQGRRREDRRVHQAGEGQELQRQADGLRPPRLQELRPARQADARDLPRGAGRARPARRPAVQAGDGAGEDRAGRRLLRRAQAVPERRLLLRHRAARDRHPGQPVHRRSSRWRARWAGSRSSTR